MTSTDLSPLANHLWQSTFFAAAAWLLTLAVRKNGAAVRYWIWLTASVKFLVPFSVLVSIGSQLGWRSAPVITKPQFTDVMNELSRPFGPSAVVSALTEAPTSSGHIPIILLGVWLCGIILGLVFWLRLLWQVRAIQRTAKPLDLHLSIPVMSSSARLEPGVFGIRKPVLLLPSGITDRLTPAQLEIVLAHELCHVRRRDNLTAAIHMMVEVIFWFHPLVWWIRTQLVAERERACDEEVVRLASDPQVYADAILNVCRLYLESPLPCVSGITGSNLKKRIEAIMANHLAANLSLSRKLLLISAAFGSAVGPVVFGVLNAPPARAQTQSTARQEFDVASVKPFKPGSQPENRKITASHGSLMMQQQSLRDLIAWAYVIKEAGGIKGPAWLDSEEYDIIAKAAESTRQDQLRLMLRNLLAQRFRLVLHRITEQRPIYALTLGKRSLKVREVQKESSTGGAFGLHDGVFTKQFVINMPQLAQQLPMFLDRPVLDRTGLTGVYEFTLKVELDPQTGLPQTGQIFTGFGMTPSIFAAVEELGLKLVSEKGPVDVFVIDHIERPTPN